MSTAHVVKFGIRTITPGDFNWVVSSWRNDYRKNSAFSHGMTNEVYHRNFREVIMNTLEWTPCYVAYDLENPDVTLGFLCGGIFNGYPVVHYVYVKRDFRGFGIAQTLAAHLGLKDGMPIIITHATYPVIPILKRKNGILLNPFLLYKEFRDDVKARAPEKDAVYTRTVQRKDDGAAGEKD